MKLHTGDTVVVISGKDKGKTGAIMRVLPEKNHVVIGGINMRTRHVKKTYQEAGRILKYEASIDASKVMLLDPKTKKPTRIGFVIKDGKKKRIALLSGEEVTKVRVPKTKKAVATKKTETPEKSEKATKAEKVKTEMPEKPTQKQPFWKKLQFGSAITPDAAGGEVGKPHTEHDVATQNIPRKSVGRGS
jgi:large subunit ribosomal protein L24